MKPLLNYRGHFVTYCTSQMLERFRREPHGICSVGMAVLIFTDSSGWALRIWIVRCWLLAVVGVDPALFGFVALLL